MAQEQGAAFENFLLSSPSIVSPSQYYQVKGGRFEALAGVLSGTDEDKASGTESDSSGQLLGAGYAQALSSQLVLGADLRYAAVKTDVGAGDVEGSSTEIRPTVAFTLTPMFSLGASINVVSGKFDTPAGDDSFNYNTFTLGGTLHQDLWEATLALTTANEDDEDLNANSPQTISVHGRYKIMPVLTLGARFDQADYPGIEPAGITLETESSWALILESAVSDNSRVEVAFLSTSNSGGSDGNDETELFLSGGFDLAPNMELGGQIRYTTGESDTDESSGSTFALTLSMVN
jgi:hypothetical protein